MRIPGKQFEFDVLYKDSFSGKVSSFGDISLYQVGELYCLGGYVVPEHRQWCNEISYVVNGKGIFSTDDKSYELEKGSIHFSPMGSIHSIKVPEDSNLRYIYIGFDFGSEKLDADMEKIKNFLMSLTKYSAVDKSNSFLNAIRLLNEIYNSTEFYNKMVETYMLQILIAVYRAFTDCQLNPYEPNGNAEMTREIVFAVIKSIESRIYEDIKVKTIAENIGYSNAYLSNLFKKNMGITIQQYINDKKIEKAIELYEVDKLSFAKIAEKLGYSSLQSFGKAFRRTKGCSPTKFMAKLKDKTEENHTYSKEQGKSAVDK